MAVTSLDFPYRFPSGDYQGIAILAERVDSIAARCGLTVLEWVEDGLGTMRGGPVRLPSGRIVGLAESAHLVNRGVHSGPVLYADTGAFAALGSEALTAEVLAAFAMSADAFSWRAPDSMRDDARRRAEWAAEKRFSGSA